MAVISVPPSRRLFVSSSFHFSLSLSFHLLLSLFIISCSTLSNYSFPQLFLTIYLSAFPLCLLSVTFTKSSRLKLVYTPFSFFVERCIHPEIVAAHYLAFLFAFMSFFISLFHASRFESRIFFTHLY